MTDLVWKALFSSFGPSHPSHQPYLDVTSLILTEGPHTVMQYNLKAISLPEQQKRFTDLKKAVPVCSLSHLVSFHCACVSWGCSQFCIAYHMEERRQSCMCMKLCTTQRSTLDCSQGQFEHWVTELPLLYSRETQRWPKDCLVLLLVTSSH